MLNKLLKKRKIQPSIHFRDLGRKGNTEVVIEEKNEYFLKIVMYYVLNFYNNPTNHYICPWF